MSPTRHPEGGVVYAHRTQVVAFAVYNVRCGIRKMCSRRRRRQCKHGQELESR